jgi:translation initiation factor IF-2
MAAQMQRKSSATVEPPVTVRSLSEAIGVKANELMRKFMQLTNDLITINAVLEDEAAIELAMEFGVELTVQYERTAEDDMMDSFDAPEGVSENQLLRPPVVTILGHVDHGKTSLLDYIRKADVVSTESGGITQHIGAYTVEHDGKKIAFVDTPGHEAFTAMRARGANVTDIAVVVVAADDGVMPQTREAISHAKAAGVHIVVALNKSDLPGAEANTLRILNELSQEGLIPEEYGGEVPVIRTSAISGKGVDVLLANLATIAEIYEFKANPARAATGTCLESSLSEGRGVVATVLVQDGTLKVGDVVVCGDAYGRVRALTDDKGRSIDQAGPSTPVEVSGLDAVPTAGEKFAVVDDIIRARSIAETRRDRSRGTSLVMPKTITLENLYTRMNEQKVKSLNLIIKADVQGSLEALVKELDKLANDEVPIRILHKGVGGIGESDILLANASEAIVIGFRVAPEDRAMSLAEEKSIDIRRYDIIYQVADEVKLAIEGRLEPEIKEVFLGRAVVRQVFKISRGSVGSVAGCFVTQGVIERSGQARIIRDGREIYKGSIEALKRFKDDVREVRENFECGIKIARFDDIKPDDVIEAYRIDVIKRTL